MAESPIAMHATYMPFLFIFKIFLFLRFKTKMKPAVTLSEIIRPIEKEFAAFEALYANEIRGMAKPLLGKLDGHKQGKMLRPVLVLLSAAICGGAVDDTYHTAVAVELLHTATLFHDDVIDEADTRRDNPSLNAQWGNKTAVLVGDYLLAQALSHLTKNENRNVILSILEAAQCMGRGELSQMHNTNATSLDEKDYMDVISDKTAALLSACCRTGALTAHANTSQTEALANYGMYFGVAFQMRDDMLDYGTAHIGKPLCSDLNEGKLTLPIIAHLNTLDDGEKKTIIEDIKKRRNLNTIADAVRKGAGMDYTESKIKEQTELAIRQLELFEPSETRTALEQMALYCAIREK